MKILSKSKIATYCRSCNGLRLRREALSITIQGTNIGEFAQDAGEGCAAVHRYPEPHRQRADHRLTRTERGKGQTYFPQKVGLGYLTLDRSSLTLSGGEAQRIRIATQLGSSLTGVLYILDEPSIGMHPRDCAKLLESLSSIKEAGNTIIVVEHDEETIRWADHVIDMGPGAGLRGGWVTASGTPGEIARDKNSLTGKYLNGSLSIGVPAARRTPEDFIRILGAQEFNLHTIDVDIPIGAFTCVTGVSGSGKSTLVVEVLYKTLVKKLYGGRITPGRHKGITGAEGIDRIINVDQSPLGKTPRSNPATYTGIFSFIRNLFSQVSDAKIRGYSASRFSFNVSGGRCDSCGGDGLIKVAMHFLPDVYIPCDVCKGKRYNRETLDIAYKGKNIAEVLDMTISEALQFFAAIPSIRQKLEVLEDVGLGYLQLGQPASTLSGGEAQRVKLSKELGKKSTGNTLYILDEPTTGLHFADIQKLLNVISSLVDTGNTVIVIEHNLDVMKSADYIIDLGPGGGDKGGRVIAKGAPEEIIKNPLSHTGKFLKDKLRRFSPVRAA